MTPMIPTRTDILRDYAKWTDNGGDPMSQDEQKEETVYDIRLTNALRSLNDGYGLLEAAAISAKVRGDSDAQEIWQYSREGLALVKQVAALIESRKVKE